MVSKKSKKGSKQHPPSLHPKKDKEENTTGFPQSSLAPTSRKEDPIFFWKEDGPNGWLCQWYRCTFIDPSSEIKFTCAEQWMMYHKALNCGDTETAALILKTTSPRRQKDLGAKAANFNEARWRQVRSGIVERGNLLKFRQGTNVAGMEMSNQGQVLKLRDLLIATGERELVEASPYDRIWGIGYGPEQARRVPREQWGENLLGKALMRVRDILREEKVS